ncbi:iron transporter [Telmatospirillum siberiense]|uniref:Iron transporter n=1 Tax=Telmatospirillum siberiense TaxID=382514 RepID=A0A2N3PM24_9PROT|nr:iron transporter [Telmatospirillum siberiense]
MRTVTGIALALVTMMATGAMAAEKKGTDNPETPIGETKALNAMDIAAVYLNPIEMEPHGIDMAASQADVHLEVDVHAAEGNPNGFGAGEWIPALTITYRLENKDTGKTENGTLMPMVAADGPHYGSNVKMLGTGNYHVSFHIDNPQRQGFGRHTDKATGVGPWFQPFSVDYDFSYVPKKK